ncbi:unnamed protein product, partial [marine sediment metagenome]
TTWTRFEILQAKELEKKRKDDNITYCHDRGLITTEQACNARLALKPSL